MKMVWSVKREEEISVGGRKEGRGELSNDFTSRDLSQLQAQAGSDIEMVHQGLDLVCS